MVDKEIVLETIKKMYDSGIDDSVVEQTLSDIGLSRTEIKQYIAEAKGEAPEGAEEESGYGGPKPLNERMRSAEEKIDHAAMHATTHVALEEQSSVLTEVLQKLDSLEKKMSFSGGKAMPDSLISANQRLGAIERQLGEIKAELSATKDIMEKILETDRKVLNNL